MNKEELYDLIARYLDGAVSDAERILVENRLATDSDFRAEIELHRNLRTELGDPEVVQLRTALDKFMENPPPILDPPGGAKTEPAKSNTGRFLVFGMVGLLVLVGIFLWKNAGEKMETPPPQAPKNIEPAPPPPVKIENEIPPTAPIPEKRPQPIASANPKDFVENSVLEDKVKDKVRGSGLSITLSGPKPGAIFRSKNGAVKIQFQGILTGGPLPAERPLRLFVFSNRPEDWDNRRHIFDLPFQIAGPQNTDGQWSVHFSQDLKLAPGLYYLTIGRAREAALGGSEMFWFGKVVVK